MPMEIYQTNWWKLYIVSTIVKNKITIYFYTLPETLKECELWGLNLTDISYIALYDHADRLTTLLFI